MENKLRCSVISGLLINDFIHDHYLLFNFREDVENTELDTFDRLYAVGTKDLAESAKLNNTALSVEDLYILQEINP